MTPHPHDHTRPQGNGPGGSAPGNDPDARLERELSGLRARYEALREEKVRAEQDLANIRQQLGELAARARAEYGTDDPDKLTALLEEKRGENARLVEEYRAHLAGVQQGLAALDSGERE